MQWHIGLAKLEMESYQQQPMSRAAVGETECLPQSDLSRTGDIQVIAICLHCSLLATELCRSSYCCCMLAATQGHSAPSFRSSAFGLHQMGQLQLLVHDWVTGLTLQELLKALLLALDKLHFSRRCKGEQQGGAS